MRKNRTREKWTIKNPNSVENSHRSQFTQDKYYGTVFTERQQAIIDGEFVPHLRKVELIMIINKAEHLELYEIADTVCQLYNYLYGDDRPIPTEEELAEAQRIMDELTPDDLK